MSTIVKEDGSIEVFDEAKLLRSLHAAGAPETLAGDVVRHVTKDFKEGMKSEDIYEHAFSILKKHYRPAAAQYSMKKAIMELGPSGFPFEKFLGRILEAEGYLAKTGQIVQGKCVSHEVDVVAEKPGERVLVEAKFHNQPGTKTDVKVALYVDARFRDIAAAQSGIDEDKDNPMFHRAWLITNTNFTTNAIAYGKCAGLLMTGWNYPKGRTLQDLVQSARVHPVTCLTSLSKHDKQALLEKGAVLCTDILKRTELLRSIGVSETKIEGILAEGNELCTI